MVGDDVKNDLDAVFVRCGDEFARLVEGAEPWIDVPEVGDVVATVVEWRREPGIDPDRVNAEAL